MGSQNKAKREELKKAIKAQNNLCWLCGEPMTARSKLDDPRRATADHVVPKSHGGAIRGNIKAAHAICNVKRGNAPPDPYLTAFETRQAASSSSMAQGEGVSVVTVGEALSPKQKKAVVHPKCVKCSGRVFPVDASGHCFYCSVVG